MIRGEAYGSRGQRDGERERGQKAKVREKGMNKGLQRGQSDRPKENAVLWDPLIYYINFINYFSFFFFLI